MTSGVATPIRFSTLGEPVDVATDGGTDPLTAERVVRATLEHSPELQAALARVHAAAADARQARLLPNPILSIVFRFPEGGGASQIEAGLSADLLTLLQTPRRVGAADHRLRAAAAEALGVAVTAVGDAGEQVAAVQAADAEMAVIADRGRLVGRLLDLAKSRQAAGESSALDVMSLDAERVALDVEITQAASRRRQARLTLARLIGEPSGRIDWELAPWSPPAPTNTDETGWIRTALQHRPEVLARRWELAALGDEADMARFPFGEGSEAGVDAERDGDWSVGPAVATPLPLMDWGRQRRAKADALRSEGRHRLTLARRQVVEDVRRGLDAVDAAREALRQVETQLIPLSDRRVAQAEAAYQNGAADVTTVLIAQQDALAARLKRVELHHATVSAQIRLQRAVGGPGIAAKGPTTLPSDGTPAAEPSAN